MRSLFAWFNGFLVFRWPQSIRDNFEWWSRCSYHDQKSILSRKKIDKVACSLTENSWRTEWNLLFLLLPFVRYEVRLSLCNHLNASHKSAWDKRNECGDCQRGISNNARSRFHLRSFGRLIGINDFNRKTNTAIRTHVISFQLHFQRAPSVLHDFVALLRTWLVQLLAVSVIYFYLIVFVTT